MENIVYFGAGPSKLPDEVLRQVQAELLNYRDTGVSVMEISHRSAAFQTILDDAETRLRRLMSIPDNYKVLFMQAGATGQFAAVPLNLAARGTADYLVTGTWSQKAAAEAARYVDVRHVLSQQGGAFTGVPARDTWRLRPDADYVYYCDNETIEGVEFAEVPDTGHVPLVADMSSNILTRPIDITKFGLVFAGAQKNLGPAGVTVVVVREDLLSRAAAAAAGRCPAVLSYATMATARSLYNTPPCFNIYVLGLVLQWVDQQGGIAEMAARSAQKAQMVYALADESQGFYEAPVWRCSRSRTTVRLRLAGGAPLEQEFLSQADAAGFKSLKGHRSVGGLRVALYNALPVEPIARLVAFMRDFAERNRS